MTHGREEGKRGSEWTRSQEINVKFNSWEEGARGIYSNSSNELHPRQARAMEAYDLCYNCETGFHYMK
ncbi:hypothetical protein DEAC_c38370 [Desulfosporosinus acididurans]|uniref:Uncharacterized protein n=1 Tax=Desulfosporosinus acididurans TaxID=476652 RepID=A0A0J1FL13_9FIRM|nr:hypothetical protein [Desulfosporosinus acididurans]KLU64204.1 hypothetical protein DEAC_c38370 [Desulfosporosinus acididurans]